MTIGRFIYLRAISQEVLMNLISNMCPEITCLESLLHLPEANQLKFLTDGLIWYPCYLIESLIIPPATKLGGVYWIHPVCLSVCLSVC